MDESAQQVAERLGVSRPTLYSWKDQLLGHEAPSSMKRRKNSKVPEHEELERQLEALQRDVRQLQLEHALWFARCLERAAHKTTQRAKASWAG